MKMDHSKDSQDSTEPTATDTPAQPQTRKYVWPLAVVVAVATVAGIPAALETRMGENIRREVFMNSLSASDKYPHRTWGGFIESPNPNDVVCVEATGVSHVSLNHTKWYHYHDDLPKGSVLCGSRKDYGSEKQLEIDERAMRRTYDSEFMPRLEPGAPVPSPDLNKMVCSIWQFGKLHSSAPKEPVIICEPPPSIGHGICKKYRVDMGDTLCSAGSATDVIVGKVKELL